MSPLVFGLVADDNPILQATLWREAIFTIGKNFPESAWISLNIKKDFLPKLYKCLKEAGFGAQTSLYENFVKFVSVCPIYNLTPATINNSDKLNKASFKERCNLIRECLVNLFAGLKIDEAALFHTELVAAYFESLAFILLKRVQVLHGAVSEADLEFAGKEVLHKLVELPVLQFVESYSKLRSKAMNERNIRVTIPSRLAKMLVDLAEREFDL